MVSQMTHLPVMYDEVLQYLSPQEGDCIVDCTLGLGGHALGIVKLIGAKGCFIGIDRDGESLELAKSTLEGYGHLCHFVQSDFRDIDQILQRLNINKVDGILLDLGVSSFQLDNPVRGFSIKADGPLDMRMDKTSYICAYDLVNSLSEKEISTILKNFGEERWHHRIANLLVKERNQRTIESTQDLSDIVMRAIPHWSRREKIHPATRTFQAFRIAVNRELEALEIALTKCVDYLNDGARLCVISFHSLEDRIVKQRLKYFVQGKKIKLIFKKPLTPADHEVENNPRARSAKLRVAERIQ